MCRNVGRCSARPRARVNAALVTGLGRGEVDRARARRRCSMAWRMARTSSSSVIQDIHWLPGAGLAAEPELEERQLLAQRAAVEASSTMPVRRWATRMPAASAGGGGALPGQAHLGEEVVAGVGRLGEHLVAPVAVVPDGRSADQHGRRAVEGGQGRASSVVPCARLSWIRAAAWRSSGPRAMPSPARWTTASMPSSPAGVDGRRLRGVPVDRAGDARGLRDHRDDAVAVGRAAIRRARCR